LELLHLRAKITQLAFQGFFFPLFLFYLSSNLFLLLVYLFQFTLLGFEFLVQGLTVAHELLMLFGQLVLLAADA
jgi:hypothetical protein